MRSPSITYDAFAGLLSYPQPEYREQIEACLRLAPSGCCEELEQFSVAVEKLATHELQELFTGTFDLNPVCSLELGWHLFGENYERGLLLVRMREELRGHGVEESSELPDHLTHVLRLLGRMDDDPAADFTAACVLPALEKMQQAMLGKSNPFQHVLQAAAILLRREFSEIPRVSASEAPLKVLA